MSFEIVGTGKAEPEGIVTNRMLEEIMDTSDEWIVKRTGIRERRKADGETMRQIALKAAENAIEDAGIDKSLISYIIFATLGGDYFTPSAASVLALDLGISCPGFDLNAACAGFLYALDMAGNIYSGGKEGYILVLGMDFMSRYLDYSDRSTAVLFGDGGGACVLKKGNGLLSSNFSSSPAIDPLYILRESSPRVTMQGKEVYRYAVGQMAEEVEICLEKAHLEPSDIDYLIPHQANIRILESAAQKIGIDPDKTVCTIAGRGNTSSGTIPSALDDLNRDGKLKKGMKIALVSFGAGMTSGGIVLEWTKEDRKPTAQNK